MRNFSEENGRPHPSFRGAPSTVKNFMTSSGCSLHGAPPKRKRYQPYWGVAQFWNDSEEGIRLSISFVFKGLGSPTVRNLEIQNLLWDFRGVSGLVPDFTPGIWLNVLGAPHPSCETPHSPSFWDIGIAGSPCGLIAASGLQHQAKGQDACRPSARTENQELIADNASNNQDTFDHDKGQKSAISGRRLHWRLSTGFFAFSPVCMCNLVRRAP